MECWISVDVESSGQSPGTGSLISLGACLVEDWSTQFYAEVRPEPGRLWSPAGQRVHGLSRRHLEEFGESPDTAMARFADWAEDAASGRQPVFVGANAAFDWSFVNDYLLRYVGRNPFGTQPLDILAYGAGVLRLDAWRQVSHAVAERFPSGMPHTHNALDDAIEQAALATRILTDAQ